MKIVWKSRRASQWKEVVCNTEPLLHYILNIDDHTGVVAIPYYTIGIVHLLAPAAEEAEMDRKG